MVTYNSFEDLPVWQKARKVCQRVHQLKLNTDLGKDFKLYNQINGASGSIMDNIAEGFERDGKKEFRQFLGIAKASCGEVQSQCWRIKDRGYMNQVEFESLREACQEIGKQLSGFISYLNKSEVQGIKYKGDSVAKSENRN